MSFLDSRAVKPKKVLIVTSSGGGGLLQAAVAKEQEILVKDPKAVVISCDILKDWTWKRLGAFCIRSWNGAQIKGDVKAQKIFLGFQALAEYLFWPQVFYYTLRLLFKEEVDHVIDTQPIGTAAILKAIRIYNRKRNKSVKLEKVVVDLPTKKATHFFRPIRRLGKKDKAHLRLTTIRPLLEEGQTAEEFWKANCRLSEKEIQYEEVYVRQAFKKFQGKPRPLQPVIIPVRHKSKEERLLMQKTFQRGKVNAVALNEEIHFTIQPEDRVFTVLLGSQPANEATFSYVKRFIQLAKETNFPKVATHLFVFSAEHNLKGFSLLRKIADYVAKIKDYPAHLSVVPFSFQKDDVIAPIFHRSDVTITRSGGQTAMELMCVSTGTMCIHSEAKKEEGKELTTKQLLLGIPGWEAENALYLQKVRGAALVTPETILPFLRKTFRPNGAQSLPIRDLVSNL